eukprot:Hpha_TRINITY_DN16127_c1_g3::TRINITY_DN16127_c1_g3_i1::g.5239::m.5239
MASQGPPVPLQSHSVHQGVRKHLSGHNVYFVLTGDKVTVPRRSRKEKRFIVGTAAWLCLMAQNGDVKRVYNWDELTVTVLRSGERVSEVMLSAGTERDVTIALSPIAPESSHNADDALAVLHKLSAPYNPNREVIKEASLHHGQRTLAEQMSSPKAFKPGARDTKDKAQSPSLSPTSIRSQTSPPRGGFGGEQRRDAQVARKTATSPPTGGRRDAREAREAREARAAGSPQEGPSVTLEPGMRVRVDGGKLGRVEREFKETDLSSPFGGGLASERMARHLKRASFWWVTLDMPQGTEEQSVLRKASAITPLVDAAQYDSEFTRRAWDGGWS